MNRPTKITDISKLPKEWQKASVSHNALCDKWEAWIASVTVEDIESIVDKIMPLLANYTPLSDKDNVDFRGKIIKSICENVHELYNNPKGKKDGK